MPNPIIEQFRNELFKTNYIPASVKKQRNLKKFQKEILEKNKIGGMRIMAQVGPFPAPGAQTPFAPVGGAPVGVPGGAPVPGGAQGGAPVPRQGDFGTGVMKKRNDQIRSMTVKSTTFRPKAIIVDGNKVEKVVIDRDHTKIKEIIALYKSNPENRKLDRKTNQYKEPSINTLQAVKMLMERDGTSIVDYAKRDEQNKIVTEIKNPTPKAIVISFPLTEGGNEMVEIVKKSDFLKTISNHGGFGVAGTINPSSINPEKLEIPVAIVARPTVRTNKATNERKTVTRIVAEVAGSFKEKNFNKNNIGMLDIFGLFPFQEYKYERIVPLKLFETIEVEGKKVAVLDTDPESKLARYKAFDNPLTEGYPGAEIMNALGISPAKLASTFSKRQDKSLETETDLVESVVKSFTENNGIDIREYMNAIQ